MVQILKSTFVLSEGIQPTERHQGFILFNIINWLLLSRVKSDKLQNELLPVVNEVRLGRSVNKEQNNEYYEESMKWYQGMNNLKYGMK